MNTTTSCAVATFLNLSMSLRAQRPAGNALNMAEFEKLHKELQPPKDELWRTIYCRRVTSVVRQHLDETVEKSSLGQYHFPTSAVDAHWQVRNPEL
ncbi:MAG TPA: hypothetical protein VKE98_20015 [Gemmataceae bacterium]|nr:hypothetical protein [Gemmataceae bacterium]